MKLQAVISIAFFSVLSFSSLAHAQSKPWGFGYGPGHWEALHEFQPYTEHPTQTQNGQWDKDPWTPASWAQQKGSGQAVIDGFFKADIIRKQYTKHGTPAVDIGPAFYQLGGNDQRRVAAMIDDVYGITSNKVYGMYTLYDWNTHRAIGTYTQYGLVMK